MKPDLCSTVSAAAAVVLLAVAASDTAHAANIPHRVVGRSPSSQIVFGGINGGSFEIGNSDSINQQAAQASPADSSSTPAKFHSSHAGLYVNKAHLDYLQKGISQPFTLFFDTAVYDASQAKISVSQVQRRNWDTVTTNCYYQGIDGSEVQGGIEGCELRDLQRAQEEYQNNSRGGTDGSQSICVPKTVSYDGRAIFGSSREAKPIEHTPDTPGSGPPREEYRTKACHLIEEVIGRRKSRSAKVGGDEEEEEEPKLFSLVVSATVPLKDSSTGVASDETETKHFWIGHLHQPKSHRALWPLAGNAHNSTSGEVRWTGREVNRIAGMMYDPQISYTKPSSDREPEEGSLEGVHVQHARWNLGLSIRSPFNTLPSDPKTEPVHAPVAGEVVWRGRYRRGAPGHRAAEDVGYIVSIRDEWGFVWHISGMDEHLIKVQPGDEVISGQVVGHVPRQGRPTLNGSETAQVNGPYRFRSLRLAVARPDVRWTHWPDPFSAGWTFYDPLHLLTEESQDEKGATSSSWRSTIPPYANPVKIFFADPTINPLSSALQVTATSTDFFTPTLSGKVQIISSFDAFVQTPGDAGDALDGIGLYSLQWGVIHGWQDEEQDWDPAQCRFVGNELDGSEWHVAFEYDKITPSPNRQGADPESVFTHIVPSFQTGRFFKSTFHSAFDTRERHLFYIPTRSTRGQPDIHGAWDTTHTLPQGNGRYTVLVRAIDFFGNVGCTWSKVNIKNSNVNHGDGTS